MEQAGLLGKARNCRVCGHNPGCRAVQLLEAAARALHVA